MKRATFSDSFPFAGAGRLAWSRQAMKSLTTESRRLRLASSSGAGSACSTGGASAEACSSTSGTPSAASAWAVTSGSAMVNQFRSACASWTGEGAALRTFLRRVTFDLFRSGNAGGSGSVDIDSLGDRRFSSAAGETCHPPLFLPVRPYRFPSGGG